MRRRPPWLNGDALVTDPAISIVVCCGSGGVGKTTTAAALALRAADAGRSTVVLTIDPARRLATSLGLTDLDNTPRLVQKAGSPLYAMQLDMKRTFDEVVLAHTSPDKARQIFANPFYQALSSQFAGTQEYMAMEKLGQLAAAQTWDLIVVDTPPSRSALDFLDAPQRMAAFLDGRMLRLLLAPARAGGRAYFKVVNAGFQLFGRVIHRVIGSELLTDVSHFVAAMETMFGSFRERAQRTYTLLKDPATAFIVVATPAPDPLREASYFVDRLATEQMPLAGLVLNRVHRPVASGLTLDRARSAAQSLDELTEPGAALAAGVLRVHAERLVLAEREQRLADRFYAAHPSVPVAALPALAHDAYDLAALRILGSAFADGSAKSPSSPLP